MICSEQNVETPAQDQTRLPDPSENIASEPDLPHRKEIEQGQSPIKTEDRFHDEDDELPSIARHFPKTLINIKKLERFASAPLSYKKNPEKECPREPTIQSSENSFIEETKLEKAENNNAAEVLPTKVFDEENCNEVINIERIKQEANLIYKESFNEESSPLFTEKGPHLFGSLDPAQECPYKKELITQPPFEHTEFSPQRIFGQMNPLDFQSKNSNEQSVSLDDDAGSLYRGFDLQNSNNQNKLELNSNKKPKSFTQRKCSAGYEALTGLKTAKKFPKFRSRSLSNDRFRDTELMKGKKSRASINSQNFDKDIDENIQEDVCNPIAAFSTKIKSHTQFSC